MSGRFLVPTLVAVGIVGCSPRRHLDIEFTAQPMTGVDVIQQVGVEIFDGNKCVCADLDNKDGCRSTGASTSTGSDSISSLSFAPGNADRSAGGFPDGALVVRVRALDAGGAAVGLRIDCWCAPDRDDQTLIFPLGGPTETAGKGCGP